MKKLEIEDIISLFDDKEWKRFGDYVRSPFFSIPERVTLLYELIESMRGKADFKNISREDIALKALKGSGSSANIRRLFSDFRKAAEDFFEFTWLESDSSARRLVQLKHLRQKKLTDQIIRKIGDSKKELPAKEPCIDTYRYSHDLYELEYLTEADDDFRKYSDALQSSSDALDAYYFSRKLLLFQLMYTKELLSKESSYRRDMKTEIEGFIGKNKVSIKEKYPDIYLKYLMLQMLDSPAEEKVLEYREYLESKESVLSKTHQADYYSDLYNYLTIRISMGEHSLRSPLLSLYKIMDQKDFLFDSPQGQIHPYTFKQVADTAFFIKDLKWAEYFIRKYSPFIADKNSKNITSLELAKLHNFKGDSRKAKDFINQVGHRDYIHYLDSKKMLICIYYDESNFNEADMVINSVNKYLRNSTELTKIPLNNAKRFIYYIRKLLKLKETGADDFLLEGIREELNRDKESVYARNWLLEKIDELNDK